MSEASPQYPPGALPVGTKLGEFEVRGVLGVGGFGIVYHAFDHLLERDVAVKEYMPATLAGREGTQHISLLSESNADTFALGLRSFVNEARLLARFDHPSLLKVHRFWEGNGTAYMAMALYRGRNLRDVRARLQQRPDEAWVRSILEPLLGALEKLHSEDVYHRDIAPDNILIEADGRPVLLDFGAARRVISDRSQTLTAILKPSYAPIEQYADTPGLKQGPWTDVYALGATMHFLLVGRPPPPAPARTIHDMLPRLADQGLPGCSQPFLALIDWMLAPRPEDRPQNIAVIREALAGRIVPPPREALKPNPLGVDPESTVPLGTPRSALATPVSEPTQVVPRPAPPPPPVPADDSEATVLIPRTGMPPRTAMPPAAPPSTGMPPPRTGVAPPPAVHNGIDDATVRIVRPSAPPPADDPDATVVTPRSTVSAGRTMQPAAVPPAPLPPAPPPPAPPPRTTSPPRPAPATPPPAEPKRGGMTWLIPAAAGAVVTIGLAVWLWPGSSPPSPPPDAAVAPAPQPAPAPAVQAPPPAPEPAASVATVPPAEPAAPAPPPPAPAPEPKVATPTVKPAPVRPPATVTRPPPRAPEPGTQTPPRAAETTPAPAPEAPRAAASVPAPVAPPAAAPAPAVASPSERCARQLPLVRLICIDIECGKPELAQHPECVKLRADQARTLGRQ